MSNLSAQPLRHVAFIMDGNGRWAKQRHLPRVAGHAKGAMQAKQVIKACAARQIEYVTLYAFSTENWARPADEVSALMGLFLKYLKSELEGMVAQGVRLKILGDLSEFSAELREAIAHAEKMTQDGDRIQVNVAANYGGRAELVSAVRQWISNNPKASPQEFDDEAFQQHLLTRGIPDPDLLVRTGGECRLSNFLLWQSAYTELYFTDTLWPAFDEKALDAAIAWYRLRERRFGKTSEQIAATD
jgi:undecaprenyl diphosphate synthase